jgi:polyhydroxyalkanoate synthase
LFRDLDRAWRGAVARLTLGVSPYTLFSAWSDWAFHLAQSPGKRAALAALAIEQWFDLLSPANAPSPASRPAGAEMAANHRFADQRWHAWPYDMLARAFLNAEQWWHEATTDIGGMSRHNSGSVPFGARQWLDALAPSSRPAVNPEVIDRTLEEGGANLVRGWHHWLDDVRRAATGVSAVGEFYTLGVDLAATLGRVVYRNELMELIQYAPATERVQACPVLIAPAWIMKYYILDLSPRNSLVRYLVQQGHTVFVISWKNPTAADRETRFDEYRRRGVMAAIEAVSAIVPGRRIHACGYCLGGTTLAIAAAAMAREGDDRLASMTLLAAQTDFADAGELTVLIDASGLAHLEDLMWQDGVFDAKQMAGAFQLLRSNDLIWTRAVRRYFLGENDAFSDLAAWNADSTRMPYRMHSEYLRALYLENRLTAGRYAVEGRPVVLRDIGCPIFAVGTATDHVAPWRSVYKISLFTDVDLTFVLAAGGHNAGIVSEIGHPGRSYHVASRTRGERYVDPDTWASRAVRAEGSWWPEWNEWLNRHGERERVSPPSMGSAHGGYLALEDAPGCYIFGR